MSDPFMRPDPQEDWDDLMRQLREQPKARPRPFFYQRVRHRLAAGAAGGPPLLGWLRRPAYALLCGAVVLALAGDGATLRPAAGSPRGETRPPRLLPR
ncbi:MAG: hypothetical protein ACRYFR_00585 [Janthinobacterium lividum]